MMTLIALLLKWKHSTKAIIAAGMALAFLLMGAKIRSDGRAKKKLKKRALKAEARIKTDIEVRKINEETNIEIKEIRKSNRDDLIDRLNNLSE